MRRGLATLGLAMFVAIGAMTNATASTVSYGGGSLVLSEGISPPSLASPYPSSITVSDGGVIQDLDVRLPGVTHPAPDELDVLLVGPGGQRVMLMSDAAGAVSFNNFDITLDDEAGIPIPDAPVTRGLYLPTDNPGDDDSFPAPAPAGGYGTSLGVFDNTFADGEWRLFVSDDTPYDGGAIATWVLRVTQRPKLSVAVQGIGSRESAGVQQVRVTRGPGGLAGQVDYTTGGTLVGMYAEATPGVDYVPTSGTITFAPGEMSKTFEIQLIDDAVVEPVTESVPITLRNARGDTSLGPTGEASSFTLISDDDIATSPPLPRPPSVVAPSLTGARSQHLVGQRMKVRIKARSSISTAC
jgi:subtilisin-like proprotein convertase family protein